MLDSSQSMHMGHHHSCGYGEHSSHDDQPRSTPSLASVDQGGTLVNRRTVYESVPKDIGGSKETICHSVKLAPLVDHSQTTPLTARVAVRKLTENGIIKIGRLERTDEKSRPIVYTSKVVSRNHAELVLRDGAWFVRDVGSSSGTFLNNERLSPPSSESPLRQVITGDVIKFGVDFRGGQEPHFRAIRVRVEIDGGANSEPMEFHKSQFAKLKGMADINGGSNLETCALCLEQMAPFNSLFVAPCCHMWHYKCIRSTVVNNYPFFECPLCRKTFDLEDASEDDDESEQSDC